VDLGDPVLEGGPFDLILYLAIPENALQGNELSLLESLGELREIPPGEDAMPFGAGFVLALSFFQLSWVAMLSTTYSLLF
jgi:hypothetical protein